MRLLHIKATDGDDVWINPAHIISIGPVPPTPGCLTAPGRLRIRSIIKTTDGHIHTTEDPADLMIRMRVELGGDE